MSVLSLLALSTTASLYGLDLVHNGPAQVALSSVDPATGNVTVLGPPLTELFGMSDLIAIANGLFFYLGDTPGGATLVAISLSTGLKVCSAHVNISEISFVGIGQSLDFDATSDRLVLSGVNVEKTAHVVYRGDASASCGGFELIGTYGLAQYLPMLHASTLDPTNQRLYVTLAHSSQGSALGVIDLAGEQSLVVFDEGLTPDLHDLLLGMHFDAARGRLVGVIGLISSSGISMQLHAFDTGLGIWEPAVPISGLPASWNTLGGNSGVVSTLDSATRTLYFLAGEAATHNGTQSLVYYLAAVDIDSVQLKATHPRVQRHCAQGYCDSLMALESSSDETRS